MVLSHINHHLHHSPSQSPLLSLLAHIVAIISSHFPNVFKVAQLRKRWHFAPENIKLEDCQMRDLAQLCCSQLCDLGRFCTSLISAYPSIHRDEDTSHEVVARNQSYPDEGLIMPPHYQAIHLFPCPFLIKR